MPLVTQSVPFFCRNKIQKEKNQVKEIQGSGSEPQLPVLVDNRLYFHYRKNQKTPLASNSQKQDQGTSTNFQVQPSPTTLKIPQQYKKDYTQNQHHLAQHNQSSFKQKRNKTHLMFNGSKQSLMSPFQMVDKGITISQDEEQRMFQRFLRTFNNKNWNDFANKMLENDKNLVREMQGQVQSTKSFTKNLSRNSLLSQGGSATQTTKTATNIFNPNSSQSQPPKSSQSNLKQDNMNHYLAQFHTFKSHQWSKLNLELNQSRAQTTIQKMVDVQNARQDLKDWKDKLQDQEKMQKIIQQIKDQRDQTKQVISNNVSQNNQFLDQNQKLQSNHQESTLLLNIQNQSQGMISKDQTMQDQALDTEVTILKSKNNFGLRKFSDTQYEQNNSIGIDPLNNPQNISKIKKFQRQNEITQLRSSLNQLNVLQQIGSTCLRKYDRLRVQLFPGLTQTMKHKSKSLKMQGKGILQKTKKTNLIVNSLDYMIEKYVKSEDPRFVNRLTNEQLILIFTLSDLRDQLSTECSERGELVEKILALFFDMFTSYDLSFDKIIQQELNIYKEGIKLQNMQKDNSLKQKEKELDKAFSKVKEIEDALENNNNKVQALLAQKKASEIRFKVTRNLIDNLIFNYKQKIKKLYAKNRDQRIMARDFIYELKELKRFSEKDDDENDKSMDEQQQQDMAMKGMRKKFNKCTQTMQVFGRNKSQNEQENNTQSNGMAGSLIRDSLLDAANQSQEKHKKQRKRKGRKNKKQKAKRIINNDGEEVDINLDGFDKEDLEDDNLDEENHSQHNQSQNEEDDDQNGYDSDASSQQYDDYGNPINTTQDQPTKEELDHPNLSNIDSEGNDIMDEKSEQALNEEEKLQMQKENQYFQILEEYEPQQVLDMIVYYNYHIEKEQEMQERRVEKDVQTEPLFGESIVDNQQNSTSTFDNGKIEYDSAKLPQEPRSSLLVPKQRKLNKLMMNTPQIGHRSGKVVHHAQTQEIIMEPLGPNNNDISMESGATDQMTVNNGQGPHSRRQPSMSNFKPQNQQQLSLSKQHSSNGSDSSPLKRNTTLKGLRAQELQSLTVDEILEDIQNIDVSDFETMLASEGNKMYKKRSMQFLNHLVSQLKKTKIFKGMVEKAAKDKIREEDKKEQAKQEKWLNKKGAGSNMTSPASRGGRSGTGKQNSQAINFNSAVSQAQQRSQSHAPNSNKDPRSPSNNTGNIIIEEASSQSSDQNSDRGTGNNTNKQGGAKPKPLNKSNHKNQNVASKSNFLKNSKKKSLPKNQINTSNSGNDKGIQVNTLAEEQQKLLQDQQQFKLNMLAANHLKNSSIDSQAEPQRINQPFVNIQLNSYDDGSTSSQQDKQPITSFGAKLAQIFRSKLESKIMQTNPALLTQLPYRFQTQPSTNVTVAVPFNLGHQRTKKVVAQHPMTKLLPLFIERFAQNDKKFLNVNQMSIKQLLKFIQQFYLDKYTTSRDSLLVKQQMMSDFVYDQLYNKYGIASITEKKLKEIFLTIKFNQSKNLTVSLFSKFTGLDEVNFTNDDLSFFYQFNRLMVFGDCFQQAIRRDINLESQNIIFQNSYEVFISYFQKKVQPKSFTKIQEELQLNIKAHAKLPPPGTNGIVLIPTEKYFEVLIDIYRGIKFRIFDFLMQNQNFLHLLGDEQDLQYPGCFQDRTFELEEFNKLIQIVSQISGKGSFQDQMGLQEHLPLIFERNRIWSQAMAQEEKRITLESVIGVIFKQDLLIL
eukprot:403347550